MELDELIKTIEDNSKKELSDEYLEKNGNSTRKDVGVGEYSYGIVMVPIEWVLPHLKELREYKF